MHLGNQTQNRSLNLACSIVNDRKPKISRKLHGTLSKLHILICCLFWFLLCDLTTSSLVIAEGPREDRASTSEQTFPVDMEPNECMDPVYNVYMCDRP